MRTRIAARLGVIALGTIVPVIVAAGPALAKINPDDGEVRGPSLGTGGVILRFVVIPLGVFAIISALALLPSALSKPRYRPGKPWEHDPLWVGGPGETPTTTAETTARGGASAEW